jgi:hypothetical protein
VAPGSSGCGPTELGGAVAALAGLPLGDWLALRILAAGALPRLLELLAQVRPQAAAIEVAWQTWHAL